MKTVSLKDITITPDKILFASTSEIDYEMSRAILLEVEYEKYVLITGSHCSCYGFDEIEFDAMEYTADELKKLPLDYGAADLELKAFIKRNLMTQQAVEKTKETLNEKLEIILCRVFDVDGRFIEEGKNQLLSLIDEEKGEAKIEAYDEFFLTIDKEFGSFKIDEAMGKILQKLKAKALVTNHLEEK